MAEAGILTEDDPVELLEGEIIQMCPIGKRHAACVKRLRDLLGRRLKGKATIGVQDPVVLNDYSEPQPDVSVLKYRADYYASELPTSADVFFVVEVADTTVDGDRQGKLPAYARAGILEAWLIDLPGDRLEIHSQPVNGVYSEIRLVQRGQRFTSKALPQLKLKADDLLG